MNIGSTEKTKQLYALKLSVIKALKNEYLLQFNGDYFTDNQFHGHSSNVTIPDERDRVYLIIDYKELSYYRFNSLLDNKYEPHMCAIFALKREIKNSYSFLNELNFFVDQDAKRQKIQDAITEECHIITSIINSVLREKELASDELEIEFVDESRDLKLVISFSSLSDKSLKAISTLLSATKFEPRITEIPELVIND